MPEPLGCWCGGDTHVPQHAVTYSVLCVRTGCHARGSQAETRSRAIEKWNKVVTAVHHWYRCAGETGFEEEEEGQT